MMTLEPGFRRVAALIWGAQAITTLVNTTLPVLAQTLGFASPQTGELRDWILIGHAVLGLFASWYLAAALLPRAPGAAGAGLMFALIEKGAELAGQILVVFTVHRGWRAELARTAEPAQRAILEARIGMFHDLWDDTFLVFWTGALLSNLCWFVAARHVGPHRRGLRIAFLVMALLTVALILEDYAGQSWISAWLPFVYPVLLTGSRAWIAWWLRRS
jgi:hypothetical protein